MLTWGQTNHPVAVILKVLDEGGDLIDMNADAILSHDLIEDGVQVLLEVGLALPNKGPIQHPQTGSGPFRERCVEAFTLIPQPSMLSSNLT